MIPVHIGTPFEEALTMTPENLRDPLPSISTDGRSARRDRGRIAALDAAVELFEEENLEPTLEQIAQRAGLSTRSVYRYFHDREDLVRAVIAHRQMQVLPLFQIEALGEGDLAIRLELFVRSRLRLHEAIGATARAMTIKSSSDPMIREQVDFRKSMLLGQIESQFAREFSTMSDHDRRVSSHSIDALTQFESLDRYRVDLGFTIEETHELIVPAIHSLLGTSR